MRHGHGYRKLGRTSAHRKALLKNLTIALVENQKIETTLMKAKELQGYVEKLITKAGAEDSMNAHRAIFAHLQHKEATQKMVVELAPKYRERKGGYTRIIKTGLRRGDAAPLAIVELV